jgi:hypothetical protein
MRCREGVRAGEVRGRTATKVAPAAHGVAAAAEMTASTSGSVSATATTTAPAAMLRDSQARRSRNRHAEREGANGSDYISSGRFDHNSPPRFRPASSLFGAGRLTD